MHQIVVALIMVILVVNTMPLPSSSTQCLPCPICPEIFGESNIYQCSSPTQYIVAKRRCDTHTDCLGGDDENGCTGKVHSYY